MKSLTVSILASILLAILLAGCEKAPVNSRIEGHWKLEHIRTLSDNKTTQCSRIYYSITRMVTEVAEKDGSHNYGAFIARTIYKDNESVLVLKDFKRRAGTADDGATPTKEQLLPFGIDNPKETTFKVVESSHRQLILESPYARLVLKRF